MDKTFSIYMLFATLALAMVAALAATFPAHAADETGPYLVLDAGASTWDVHSKDVNDGSVSGSLDRTDITYGLRLGYSLNRYLALEAGYRDLGTSEFKGTSSGGSFWCPGKVSSRLKAYTLEASALGKLPITPNFRLFGSAGAARWSSNLKVNDSCDSISQDDTGVSLALGLGAEYTVTERLGLRAEVRRYDNVADHYDVYTASVGAIFRF